MSAAVILGMMVACGSGDVADTAGEQAVDHSDRTPDPIDDPSADTGDTDTLDDETCEPWVDVMGSDEPVVGDSHTYWVKCEYADGHDVLLTGATVVVPSPAEAALVDSNTVTFIQAGPVDVRVQVGSTRLELSFEVLP